MSFLDSYEPLDVIGNGSFGIIRKVRRKSDGQIFARKELNFERMSERDRKQIVAEVNILKDLHHDHIVRYHDRHVDREAGILYIIMEYCSGGDLLAIIAQATKHNRPIPEDTIWSYFMQLLLALHHCHHPNHPHPRAAASGHLNGEVKERRPQILHRDLKPDNIFLDASNSVKLGDFGLSKALSQASFANTYVGTPYYMSPELMQEKAYDSKSDIWSLGCLIYELCALKPPFHEAKTHAELSVFIRNGRIPPLPKGYSQALSSVIKSMLNLNPAMRPSASQLLQHERLDLFFKISETDKLLATVQAHKATLAAQERALQVRESTLTALLAQKDAEIASLSSQLASHRAHVRAREEELRARVAHREEEVAEAMRRREEEILRAVRKREAELARAWEERDSEVRERTKWVTKREEELREREKEVERLWREAAESGKGRTKTPLEDLKNLPSFAPLPPPPRSTVFETPIQPRAPRPSLEPGPSAMKGVVLTSTGQPLVTPSPAELAKLLVEGSPGVGLDFTKIFDEDHDEEDINVDGEKEEIGLNGEEGVAGEDDEEEEPLPPSPSDRKNKSATGQGRIPERPQAPIPMPIPTRIAPSRPPSRTKPSNTNKNNTLKRRTSMLVPSSSDPAFAPARRQSLFAQPTSTAIVHHHPPSPRYDLADEENLPSPFLKRNGVGAKKDEKEGAGAGMRRRGSLGSLGGRAAMRSGTGANTAPGPISGRASITSARKAGEDARRALART